MPFAALTTTLLPNVPAHASPTKRPFLSYIHNFRAIAILFIVALHCYTVLGPGIEPTILKRGTLLFMFISGFLFQYLSGNYSTHNYWLKKLYYVILPYLVVSTPIIAVRVITHHHSSEVQGLFPTFSQWPFWAKIMGYYFTGLHLVPLWFIPMICFYYLLAPAFIFLDRQAKAYYVLPLFLALSLYITRSPETYRIDLAFVHYLSIYLLGMFVSRYCAEFLRVTQKIWPILYLVTLGLVATGFILPASYLSYSEQFLYVQKLLLCWMLIHFFWRASVYFPKKLGVLSDMSFGIYFLHYYLLFIIEVFEYKGYLSVKNNFTTFCLIFGSDLLFCFFILSVGKRIFGRKSRYLVGY